MQLRMPAWASATKIRRLIINFSSVQISLEALGINRITTLPRPVVALQQPEKLVFTAVAALEFYVAGKHCRFKGVGK
jgi:hypothetical protein